MDQTWIGLLLAHWAVRETALGPPCRPAPRIDTVQGSARTAPATVEHFLAERHRLSTVDLRRRLRRADIHRPPWPLEPACAILAENTMTEPLGVRLPDARFLLHYAAHQDVLVWPLGSPHATTG